MLTLDIFKRSDFASFQKELDEMEAKLEEVDLELSSVSDPERRTILLTEKANAESGYEMAQADYDVAVVQLERSFFGIGTLNFEYKM